MLMLLARCPALLHCRPSSHPPITPVAEKRAREIVTTDDYISNYQQFQVRTAVLELSFLHTASLLCPNCFTSSPCTSRMHGTVASSLLLLSVA